MKLNYFSRIPNEVYLAFSGGLDSSVLLHNLIRRKINVTLVHVDHGTDFCKKELKFSQEKAVELNLALKVFKVDKYTGKGSPEAYWSTERNKIYQSLNLPVLTGHHLEDAVEWYLMTSFQGQSKLLNYQSRNVIRPLLCIEKCKINQYAIENNIDYLIDPTNADTKFNLRNKVRADLVPEVLNCFPGLRTTVKRLIRAKELEIKNANNL